MSRLQPNARVLIADDSSTARALLRREVMAHDDKLTVIEVANGVDAVRMFRENRPQATFLDIHMPQMGGIEALAAIRKDDPGAHVVLVSADGTRARVEQALQLGASDFVVKPITPGSVRSALTRKKERCPAAQPAAGGKRVLLVDDSRTHRAIMIKIISKLGFDCMIEEAGDGGDGIERYGDGHYDLVLLDVNMPRLGGLVALEEIMLFDPAANVCMISASRDPDLMNECKGLGARDFLVKPVDVPTLRRAFEQDVVMVD